MANIAPLVNTRGPLFVHPTGIVKRTHFHAMALYANELEARVGRLSLTASPLVQDSRSIPVADAIATVDETGRNWAIAIVNRHPEQKLKCLVKMPGRHLSGDYAALELTGDSPEAYNDIEHPNRVAPVRRQVTFTQGVIELPPHSLTIIKLRETP